MLLVYYHLYIIYTLAGFVLDLDQSSNLCILALIKGLALPEPSAIQMGWNAALPRPPSHSSQLVPGRQLPPNFSLRQFQQKRLADAVADIYGQIATLSRVTSIFESQGVEPSGQERFIAETFCTRAAGRVRSALDQVESNDDDRMTAIAKLAYKRGNYGYALFED